MSLSFKSKFNEMQENDPTEKTVESSNYEQASSSRNVCFILNNGRRIFLNYSYLVSGEYHPEEKIITLTFTSHIVKLKGIQLDALFNEFMQYLPKQLVCSDDRYNSLNEGKASLINSIEITLQE